MISSRRVTTLHARHPTDHRWWGTVELEPSGKARVTVRTYGQCGDKSSSATVPCVDLDELQQLIDDARRLCSEMGFIE